MRHDIDLIEEVCDKPIVVNSSGLFGESCIRLAERVDLIMNLLCTVRIVIGESNQPAVAAWR